MKYSNHVKKEDCGLPNPSRPVSKKVPTTYFNQRNKQEVNVHLSGQSNGKCHLPYDT